MNAIVQCPKGCGRLVREGQFDGRPSLLNVSGAWRGYEHICCFDGANERQDTDDSPARDEELETQ